MGDIQQSRRLFRACAVIVFTIAVPAQASPLAQPSTPLTELFGGVVVDQTITMIGEEFYQTFTALWREKPESERFIVAVKERPSARLGSQIWIDFDQKRVFQAQLPVTRGRVHDLSIQAVDVTYENVVDADLQKLLFKDRDLGVDEM